MPRQRRVRGLSCARRDEGRPAVRPPPRFVPAAAEATGKIKVTDLDSRNVKTSRGWVQGYNAQVVTTEDQIVVAAEVNVDSPDFGHLEPMVSAARAALERAGFEQTPEVVLADAGYWHQVQMERLVNDGIVVLVPSDAKKRGARPGWDGGLYAFMRRVAPASTSLLASLVSRLRRKTSRSRPPARGRAHASASAPLPNPPGKAVGGLNPVPAVEHPPLPGAVGVHHPDRPLALQLGVAAVARALEVRDLLAVR